MKDIRRAAREAVTRGRAALRELNGHTLSDDVGNAGDTIRKDAANARDEARDEARRSRTRQADREADRKTRDRTTPR